MPEVVKITPVKKHDRSLSVVTVKHRDNAYETITARLDNPLDGFGELFRMLSYQEIGAAAMLSRAAGGVAAGKVVFSLPGSTKAVRLGMEKLILPQAGHLYYELQKHPSI